MLKKLLIIFLIVTAAGPVMAATRFYLPSSGASPVSPAFDSWYSSTNADRVRMVTSKSGTAMLGKSTGSYSASGVYIVNRMYISDPLAAQTISCSIKGYLLGKKSAATAKRFVLLKRWSNDGTLLRSYFFGVYATSLDLTNSYTNRGCPKPGYTVNQTFAYGERLSIEIGYYKTGPAACAMYDMYGDLGATDLPENETDTDTSKSPWIEFSQDLIFLGSGGKSLII
ncbi:MAG: hypothetical protein KKC80_02645 [Candidatus Margulisbacteria bacterium]|nr:hypothetical protein [Candidatus Margulisiibacteriota bacterium]MBU1617310.1 hypothetical protein [Candidatus Margulisiibacteriota bacterium]MBU1867626.1 hypothetical protein [Candidatus Margulisiibacteriota bacterium]